MEILFMVIGVLGSIASICGAFLAIRSEQSASNSAMRAEQARDSIVERQATSELSEILTSARSIQKIFGKYSISDIKSLAGTNQGKDASDLQEFIFNFSENRAVIEQNSDVDAQIVYQDLDNLLTEFSDSKAGRDKKVAGNKIRLILDDVIFKLRRNINKLNTTI